MIKVILQDKWFFSFIIGWVVFLLLINWKTFRKNVWGGVLAVVLELWQDGEAANFGMYHFKYAFPTILDVPVFFTFGITFTMGVIFLQFIPENPDLQLLHLLVFTAGFLLFEYNVIQHEMLVTPYWNLVGSYFDNIAIFGSMLWLNSFIKSRVKWRV